MRNFIKPHNTWINSCMDSQDLSRFFGIEVELEGWPDEPTSKISRLLNESTDFAWSTTTDNSLRNGGIELYTRYSTSIQSKKKVLDQFADLISEAPYAIASERTSTHIHIDVRDFTFQELLFLVNVYGCCEDTFFLMCNERRRHCIYCRPLKSFGSPSLDLPHTYLQENMRYGAINLSAIQKYGTIEFRMFDATKDIQTLSIWLDMCYNLVNYVAKTPRKKIIEKVKSVKGEVDYRALVRDILKTGTMIDSTYWEVAVTDFIVGTNSLD